jgi:hypothetical protein
MTSSATPGAAALAVASAALFLWTAPGRITFPDDEIVFQTTASLVERGSLAIEGIARRTGEPKGRPTGTFGWAPGVDGARYGFFGHGLSLVAAPMYALAAATAPHVPFAWTRAVRPDHYTFHVREARSDWTRLVVSLTNCLVTAAAVFVLVRWLARVGFSRRAALWTGVAYAVATAAWPYSRTFLSEPLSALVLLLAALAIAEAHARRGAPAGDRWLWSAGAAAGFSVHVHALNVTAWPCLLAYALAPAWREGHVRGDGRFRACLGELAARRRAWLGAAALAGLGLGLLLLGQWLRFGDPLETGRFGHYSAWTAPWTGLWMQMAAPGRSFWLYSPAAALGLVGFAAALRRAPAATWLALSLLVTRWAVVSGRTDWFGGWGIGPRHLVPAIPLVMIGFAAAVEELPRRSPAARRLFWAGLAAGTLLTAHLATHSIFEWLFRLMADPRLDGRPYLEVSHTAPWASPIAGFCSLEPDVLALGAIRIATLGHVGLLIGFVAIAVIGVAAAVVVARALRRG